MNTASANAYGLTTDGSRDHSFLMYIILLARIAVCQPSSGGLRLRLPTKSLEVRTKSSSTNALISTAEAMNDFHVTVMYGHCCKQERAARVSGRTVSRCYVVPWQYEQGMCGIRRIFAGPKCIRSIRSDGSTWTLARRRGIILGCMLKVCFHMAGFG